MNELKISANYISCWHFQHKDSAGNVLWEDTIRNALTNEGQESMLSNHFQGVTAPTEYYIRLYNDTPVKTDSLGDLSGEPVGNGYAPILVERSAVGFPTLALDAGDFQAVSKQVSFTASGGVIGPVTHAVLATTSNDTGLHHAFVALSTSRTLQDTDVLNVTISIKQV